MQVLGEEFRKRLRKKEAPNSWEAMVRARLCCLFCTSVIGAHGCCPPQVKILFAGFDRSLLPKAVTAASGQAASSGDAELLKRVQDALKVLRDLLGHLHMRAQYCFKALPHGLHLHSRTWYHCLHACR
jgi:hypothetical protein